MFTPHPTSSFALGSAFGGAGGGVSGGGWDASNFGPGLSAGNGLPLPSSLTAAAPNPWRQGAQAPWGGGSTSDFQQLNQSAISFAGGNGLDIPTGQVLSGSGDLLAAYSSDGYDGILNFRQNGGESAPLSGLLGGGGNGIPNGNVDLTDLEKNATELLESRIATRNQQGNSLKSLADGIGQTAGGLTEARRQHAQSSRPAENNGSSGGLDLEKLKGLLN